MEEALQVGRESKYDHKPVQTSSGLKVYTLKVASKGKHCLKGSDTGLEVGFVVHRYCPPLVDGIGVFFPGTLYIYLVMHTDCPIQDQTIRPFGS